MSGVVHPKGPLPPSVYWRRRIVVLVLVVVVIVVISLIVGAVARGGSGGSDSPSPVDTTEPDGTASTTPTPSATIGQATTAEGECDPAKLTLTADTDKSEYGTGELPQLSFTVENKSASTCELSLTVPIYTISSPSGDTSEQYWTSADCPANSDAEPVTVELAPGVPVASSEVRTWSRTRSVPGDCSGTGLEQVGTGGASFDFTVTIGDLSATKRFYLY